MEIENSLQNIVFVFKKNYARIVYHNNSTRFKINVFTYRSTRLMFEDSYSSLI